jgi:hypothetical protein
VRRPSRPVSGEICPSECLPWLPDGGFQSPQITQARGATRLREDEPMKLENLAEGQVSHYRRRSYSSRFFSSTRRAARSNSASG